MLRILFAISFWIALMQQASAQDVAIERLLEGLDEDTAMETFQNQVSEADDATLMVLFNRANEIKAARPDLFQLVLFAALSSDSPPIRALALWEVMSQRSVLNLVVTTKEEDLPRVVKSDFVGLGGSISLDFYRKDAEGKTIELLSRIPEIELADRDDRMSISGETITFTYFQGTGSNSMFGNGSLRLDSDGRSLSGVLKRGKGTRVPLDLEVKVDLY